MSEQENGDAISHPGPENLCYTMTSPRTTCFKWERADSPGQDSKVLTATDRGSYRMWGEQKGREWQFLLMKLESAPCSIMPPCDRVPGFYAFVLSGHQRKFTFHLSLAENSCPHWQGVEGALLLKRSSFAVCNIMS